MPNTIEKAVMAQDHLNEHLIDDVVAVVVYAKDDKTFPFHVALRYKVNDVWLQATDVFTDDFIWGLLGATEICAVRWNERIANIRERWQWMQNDDKVHVIRDGSGISDVVAVGGRQIGRVFPASDKLDGDNRFFYIGNKWIDHDWTRGIWFDSIPDVIRAGVDRLAQ